MSEPTEHSRPIGDIAGMADNGILWALNAHVFHPQGFEARNVDGQLMVFGWGNEAIHYPPEAGEAVEGRRVAFRQLLLDCQQFNRPGYHEGHSPGFGGSNQGSEVPA